MILADWQIRDAVRDRHILISPFSHQNINPASYDVTLGNEFLIIDHVDAIDPHKSILWGDPYIANEYLIMPQEHVLATTVEIIGLANGIVAQLNGKSSWGRLGITIHQTAGYIDPGFNGQITLEIFNVNKHTPVILRAGDRIGQLVFQTMERSKYPYNAKKGSKYMFQKGVVPSKYYKNFEGE